MLTLAPTERLLVTSKFIVERLYSSIASNDSGWFSAGRPFASRPNESLVGTRVDRDVVVAAVLAERGDLAAADVGQRDVRIGARDVLDRTVRIRDHLELALRDVRRKTLVVGLERRARCDRGDGDAGELGRVAAGDGEVQRRFFGELQVHVVLLGIGAVVARCLDVERSADAQTLRGVAAFGVGDHGDATCPTARARSRSSRRRRARPLHRRRGR